MGSPTVPRIRKDFREDFFTKSFPKDCSALMAVGAVYSSVTCAQDFLYQLCPYVRCKAVITSHCIGC